MKTIKGYYRQIQYIFNKVFYTTYTTKEGIERLRPNILYKLMKVFIIYIVVRIVVKLVERGIKRTVKNRNKTTSIFNEKFTMMNDQRADTIVGIVENIITWLIYFVGVMSALNVFEVEVGPILATAGIGGLAIGFGAQSLVQDIITGFFILFEDQYSVGDHVVIEDREGSIEELGLRVTKVRSFSGELYIIPNGQISIVTNKTRGSMRGAVVVSIAYEEDIENAKKVLNKMCKDIGIIEGMTISEPEVVGVTELNAYSVDISIFVQALPTKQWAAERVIRQKAKECLEENNIEIPYQRMVVLKGDE